MQFGAILIQNWLISFRYQESTLWPSITLFENKIALFVYELHWHQFSVHMYVEPIYGANKKHSQHPRLQWFIRQGKKQKSIFFLSISLLAISALGCGQTSQFVNPVRYNLLYREIQKWNKNWSVFIRFHAELDSFSLGEYVLCWTGWDCFWIEREQKVSEV